LSKTENGKRKTENGKWKAKWKLEDEMEIGNGK
jgi:hypothetical protein